MRITHEALMKVVHRTVEQRTRSNRNLLAAYLCGSLLEEKYLLGGTTDIDLVFIHADTSEEEREVVRLTDEVSLDIAHHLHKDYRNTRHLRVHPWLGPTIFSCQILYDPQHFMDFTQASVRGQYDNAEYVLDRSRQQAEHARQIWFGFQGEHSLTGPEQIATYLRAVEHAANSVASLNGAPLTERRFLQKFPQRAAAVGWPGLYPGLLGLLGAPNVGRQELQAWLPMWEEAYESLEGSAPPRLEPPRRAYYLQAFRAMIKGDQPEEVLWPLLRTWTLAIRSLPNEGPQREAWEDALRFLGLLGDSFNERVAALDAFLDNIEEILDHWAEEHGIAVF